MRNEFAIASLAIGILAFFQFLGLEKAALAIIFGALALREMKKKKLKGRQLAVAGIVLGAAYIALVIAMWPSIAKLLAQAV